MTPLESPPEHLAGPSAAVRSASNLTIRPDLAHLHGDKAPTRSQRAFARDLGLRVAAASLGRSRCRGVVIRGRAATGRALSLAHAVSLGTYVPLSMVPFDSGLRVRGERVRTVAAASSAPVVDTAAHGVEDVATWAPKPLTRLGGSSGRNGSDSTAPQL